MAVAASSVQVTPRKEPRQARARMLVDAILTAAEQLSSAGVETWTTNHVAERAGVSIGSIYQYFPSKESLVSALYTRLRTARLEAFADALAGGRTVERTLFVGPLALERALRRHLVVARADRRLQQVDAVFVSILAAHLQRTGWDAAAAGRLAPTLAVAIDAVVEHASLASEPPREAELAVLFEALLLR
jgi:AcrR family transcriptional regulator